MQLGYTLLYVPDLPTTRKFYAAAFGLSTRFLHDSGDCGELVTGSTALAFSSHKLMQQLGNNLPAASPTAPCFELALCTPDVAGALERAVTAWASPMCSVTLRISLLTKPRFQRVPRTSSTALQPAQHAPRQQVVDVAQRGV